MKWECFHWFISLNGKWLFQLFKYEEILFTKMKRKIWIEFFKGIFWDKNKKSLSQHINYNFNEIILFESVTKEELTIFMKWNWKSNNSNILTFMFYKTYFNNSKTVERIFQFVPSNVLKKSIGNFQRTKKNIRNTRVEASFSEKKIFSKLFSKNPFFLQKSCY